MSTEHTARSGSLGPSRERHCSVSQSCTSLLSHEPCVSQGPLSHPQWVPSVFNLSIQVGVEGGLVVLTCISLMSHDIEHLPSPYLLPPPMLIG